MPGSAGGGPLRRSMRFVPSPPPAVQRRVCASRNCFRKLGLPDGVLTVLDDTVACAAAAVQAGFDRIVLTGSADTGLTVLHAAAARLTPPAMELSGNDAMFVLPGSTSSSWRPPWRTVCA
jgi:acyl-CoA reductase-like NAD-dependent aldehyde dehydrogenase